MTRLPKRKQRAEHPSRPTLWAAATHNIHKRAKAKLGTKADTQIVRHDDLQQS